MASCRSRAVPHQNDSDAAILARISARVSGVFFGINLIYECIIVWVNQIVKGFFNLFLPVMMFAAVVVWKTVDGEVNGQGCADGQHKNNCEPCGHFGLMVVCFSHTSAFLWLCQLQRRDPARQNQRVKFATVFLCFHFRLIPVG